MRLVTPIVAASLLILGGCSTQTAFEPFKMDAESERAVTYLRTVGVDTGDTARTIIVSVYLNGVYPERYHEGESFLVALYDPADGGAMTLTLNGAAPVSADMLDRRDPLCALIPMQNEWFRYYLVRFEAQEEATLILRPGNDPSGKAALTYQKERP